MVSFYMSISCFVYLLKGITTFLCFNSNWYGKPIYFKWRIFNPNIYETLFIINFPVIIFQLFVYKIIMKDTRLNFVAINLLQIINLSPYVLYWSKIIWYSMMYCFFNVTIFANIELFTIDSLTVIILTKFVHFRFGDETFIVTSDNVRRQSNRIDKLSYCICRTKSGKYNTETIENMIELFTISLENG